MADVVSVGTNLDPQQAAIDTSSLGTSAIVSGVANRRIVVIHWNVMANGTTSIRWLSGSNNLTGLYPLVANVGCAIDHGNIPQFGLRCNAGEALNINNSAAIQIGGYVLYYIEPA